MITLWLTDRELDNIIKGLKKQRCTNIDVEILKGEIYEPLLFTS